MSKSDYLGLAMEELKAMIREEGCEAAWDADMGEDGSPRVILAMLVTASPQNLVRASRIEYLLSRHRGEEL